jgi:hypothetical protein
MVANILLFMLLTNRAMITNLLPLLLREVAMARQARQRAERLQIMLDGIELAAVDDFRFKTHMPSRASAVRELLRRGLRAEGFLTAAVGTKSSDYGVIGETPINRADS